MTPGTAVRAPSGGARPNILILQAEHHDAYSVGIEPGAVVRTPNMNRIAAQGVAFVQNRTTTGICAPSRGSLMSGLYAHAHGIWNNTHSPAAIHRDPFPHVRLWSQNLRDAGYRLFYMGKWHVSYNRPPSEFGWDEIEPAPLGGRGRRDEGAREAAGDGAGTEAGGEDGARRGVVGGGVYQRPGWPPHLMYGTLTGPEEALRDSRLTQSCIDTIERAAAGSEPWCVYVGYAAVGGSYVAHDRYLRQYDVASIPKPAGHDDDLRDKPNIYRRLHQQNWGHLTPEEVAQAIRHRYGLISYLDGQVGRVLDALERTGQAENTIVIYTGDHGDYAGAHGLFHLGVPAFDQTYRVPLLVRWPAGIRQPGRRIDAFTRLLDLGPTLLELAGAPPLESVHGRSLAPFLRGDPEPADWPQEFYGEFLGHENLYTQRQIRTREYKYVWNAFDFDELYDLRADPQETRNLNEDPAYEPVRRDLVGRLWRWALETDDVIMSQYPMNALLPYGPQVLPDVEGRHWGTHFVGRPPVRAADLLGWQGG
jgi:arylsulfatase A-like enzyme